MKRTVLEMLSTAAEIFRSNIYVSDKTDNGWQGLTFYQVEKNSSHLASGFICAGVSQGDRIAIISEGCSRWIVTEYAILKSRAVSVPLSVKLQAEELIFRMEHSGTKYVVVSKNCFQKVLQMKEKLLALGIRVIYLDAKDAQSELYKEEIPDLLFYDDLIKDGQSYYLEHSGELTSRISSIEESDVVTICYTSGTTGNPKGIMLTHLNYWANSHDAVQFFRLENNLTTLVILPLDHSFAHTIGFYCATLCSIKLCFVDARGGLRNQLKNILPNIQEVEPDFILSVPAITGNFMKKIKDSISQKGKFTDKLFRLGLKCGITYFGDGFKKPSVIKRALNYPVYSFVDKIIFSKIRKIFGKNFKFFIGGGAMLEIKQQQFFNCIGSPVMQGYGLSEASPIISVNQRHRHRFGSSGGVLSGIDCKIMNSEGKELPQGEKGYITIKGLNVMKGYFNNQKATDEVISSDGYLNTGDLGFIDKDGFLYVTGREKALLISADGEKYSPEEIEDAIVNCSEFIYQCVLYNDHNKYTSALITLDKQRIKNYALAHKITSSEKMLEVLKRSFYNFTRDSAYKNSFPTQWIPSVFNIVEEEFSQQNQMVNSTMKIVRFKVIQNYKSVIEKMYTKDGKNDCTENLAILERIIK